MKIISDSTFGRMRERLPKYALQFVPKSIRILNMNYGFKELKRDAFAGLTVAIVALPLAMALAIASGTTPERGLFTAIIAGFLISLLGGSRYQIGGPTGAFVVVIFGIIAKFGYEGLVVATIIAGVILIMSGLLRLGSFIKYIPYPVVVGFTTGIGFIILSSQIKDLFGLSIEKVPGEFAEQWKTYFAHFHTFSWQALSLGLMSIILIIFMNKKYPALPAYLIVMVLGSTIAILAGLPVDTIGSKFGGIPDAFPSPSFPSITFENIRDLMPSAITIAFLAGIESLLSAVVADGMSHDSTRSDCELVAQGVANIASAVMGGIPATGAIARTAINIRSGAVSSLSGILHAVFLFLIMIFFAPLASYVPLTCLAGVLIIVAWRMSDLKTFAILMKASKGDIFVLVGTFLLTVLVDLNLAIQFGVVMASLIFMHRMSREVSINTETFSINDEEAQKMDAMEEGLGLPKDATSFRIQGPLFFGAASQLVSFFEGIENTPKVLLLKMDSVPMIDASGINTLMRFARKCQKNHTTIVMVGTNKKVSNLLFKSIIGNKLVNQFMWADDIEIAVVIARQEVKKEYPDAA